jgi:hypothetical protein
MMLSLESAGRRVRPFRTRGEELVAFLARHHLDASRSTWDAVAQALVATGRGPDWSDAFQEMAALHLAGRLLRGGRCLLEDAGEQGPLLDRQIKQLIVDTMTVDYWLVGRVYARLELALQAAGESISTGTRTTLRNWSQREMPWCYLCGGNLDYNPSDPNAHDRFTLDHVWPQAYGGDSSEENLLPACAACNGRKAHAAAWVLYPVQSLIVGTHQHELQLMPKEMRFAVRARAAQSLTRSGLSLRDAYLDLGRPLPPLIVDSSQALDVFNLRIPEPEAVTT